MAESTKTLTELCKELNKKFGVKQDDGSVTNIASFGCNDIDSVGTLSFGTPSLDYCIYNCFPEGRFVSIMGREGSGKTSLAFMLAANYQKKEIERHPDKPRAILYVDLETTLDPQWAIKMGYDVSDTAPVKTLYVTPLDMDGEHILDFVRDAIKTNEVGFIVLDSLPMLVGQQTYAESFEKKEMGGIAKLLATFTARTTSLLKKYNCTFVGINAIRDNIGGYGASYVEPGGTAWKFACSLRLMVKRGEFVDEEGNTLTASAESPAGYRLEMAVLKIKTAKWDRKLGSTILNYVSGIDYVQDTIEVAIKLGLIDNTVQGSFKIIDTDTGEIMLDDEGNELKIRGKKNIKPWFKEHPTVFKHLYDKVYEQISKKEDTNLQQFEALMNSQSTSIDVNVEDFDKI